MNPINVSNSECVFGQKLKTKLVKQLSETGISYFFKLCCPQVIDVYNPCSEQVALKILKCFEIDGQYFSLNTAGNVEYEYHNMNNGQTQEDTGGINAEDVFGNAILRISVNEEEVLNRICFNKLLIPVEPKCLKKEFDAEKCIGEIECIYDTTPTQEPQIFNII